MVFQGGYTLEFRIISLPAFKAATSSVDSNFDFSPSGILGKFNDYFSSIEPSARDSFLPRDFLYFDEQQQGLVWIWALTEEMDHGGNDIIDFEGGYYLTYSYKDGDEEENGRLYNEALQYIDLLESLELDIRPNHYAMGHIITPPEVITALGWAQMQTYIPIRLKTK